jgi:hypothetical protein
MTPTHQNSGSYNQHARLSPSSADRWARCTASTPFIEDNAHLIPKERESAFALEGSAAHDYCEAVLTGKTLIEDVPEDFRPHVKFYVDHCNGLVQPGDVVAVEEKVPLFYSPGETGTCDFAIIRDGRVIVRDLKYGQGVLVEAENNAQLAIYALSFIRANDDIYDFPPDTIVDIGIVQPRHHADDPVRTWEVSLHDLEHGFEVKLRAAVEQVRNRVDLEFKPSDKACRWCPAKAICAHRIDGAASPVGFEVLTDLPDLTKEEKKLPVGDKVKARLGDIYSDEDLVALWSNRKNITAILADVEAYLESLAEQGRPAPGTKLVMGREGNRKWADEDAAENFLARTAKLKQDERFKFVLISPTQAEEILSDKLTDRQQKRLKELITRSPGTPSLAPADDKRPAIAAPCDAFDDLTTEPELDSDL